MTGTEFCGYVDKYRKQLYIMAYSILKNETDAEDAVCSAVLKGYEHLGQLKSSRRFKPWMITIAKNEALKIRQKRLELPGNEKVEELLTPVRDRDLGLWDIVQSLKEEYRLAIVLFYYADLPIRDIAIVLDIPVGTVKSRLNRGRENIKSQLTDEGGVS